MFKLQLKEIYCSRQRDGTTVSRKTFFELFICHEFADLSGFIGIWRRGDLLFRTLGPAAALLRLLCSQLIPISSQDKHGFNFRVKYIAPRPRSAVPESTVCADRPRIAALPPRNSTILFEAASCMAT